jgi:hypothetical protein
LRGPARTIAITAEANAIAGAIAGALDRIDMFELDGRLVLLVDGELRNVNAAILREIIRTNFATKHLVQAGAGLGVEYRPVEVGELVIRTMLTAPPRDGGLVGRVPPVMMEAPRQVEEAAPVVMMDPVEFEAGQRALAKHTGAASSERTRQEIERGKQQLAELQERPPQS